MFAALSTGEGAPGWSGAQVAAQSSPTYSLREGGSTGSLSAHLDHLSHRPTGRQLCRGLQPGITGSPKHTKTFVATARHSKSKITGFPLSKRSRGLATNNVWAVDLIWALVTERVPVCSVSPVAV